MGSRKGGEDEWAMARMNNHISKRTAEKERAVTQIRRALDAIGNEDRQPDDWEKVSLAGAIDNVFRGLYALAEVEAYLAMTPPKRRSPHRRAALPEPALAECDLDVFKHALAQAEAEDVKEYPVFGPWLTSLR